MQWACNGPSRVCKKIFQSEVWKVPFGLVHGHHFFALMGVRKGFGVGHLGDCRHDNGLEQAPEGPTFDLRPFSSKSEQE